MTGQFWEVKLWRHRLEIGRVPFSGHVGLPAVISEIGFSQWRVSGRGAELDCVLAVANCSHNKGVILAWMCVGLL